MTATNEKTTAKNNAIKSNNEVIQIPLKSLSVSPLNARKKLTNSEDDLSFIESIKEQGLLQNLVVSKSKDGFEIHDGQRRFIALGKLDSNNQLEANYTVPCRVIDIKEGLLASVATNYLREDMHVSDLFNAIFKLHEDNKSVEDISLVLSTPSTVVRKYLALGGVHPTIIKAFSDDKIDIKTIQAFTIEPDKKKQLKYFNNKSLSNHPWDIKKHFTENTCSKDSALGKFVTYKTYKDRGGAVSTDLFEDEVNFLDLALVEQIAKEKLERKAKPLNKANWKWVDVSLDRKTFSDFDNRLEQSYVGIPKKLENLLAKLEKEAEDTDSAYYEAQRESGWDLDEETETKLDDERTKAREKHETQLKKAEQYLDFTEDQKKHSGAMVTFDYSGKFNILLGVQNTKDYKEWKAFIDSNNPDKEETDTPNNVDVKKGGLTNAHKEDMIRYDIQLFQLNMMKHPKLAFRAFAFEQCYTVLSAYRETKDYRSSYWNRCFSADAKDSIYRDTDFIASDAYKEIQKIETELNTKWVETDINKSFKQFNELNDEEVMQLLGICGAMSGQANAHQYASDEDNIYKSLHELTNFNKVDYWRPTKENFFKRITLPDLHELASDLLGKKWLEPHKSLSKSLFVEKISKEFDATQNGDLPENIKKKLAEYLPEILAV